MRVTIFSWKPFMLQSEGVRYVLLVILKLETLYILAFTEKLMYFYFFAMLHLT